MHPFFRTPTIKTLLVLLLLCLVINSCKKEADDDGSDGGPDPAASKVSGKVIIPTGSPLDVNSLKVISPADESAIREGRYAVDTAGTPFSTQ